MDELIRASLRVKLRFFKIHCETNILHSVIRIEVTDSGRFKRFSLLTTLAMGASVSGYEFFEGFYVANAEHY